MSYYTGTPLKHGTVELCNPDFPAFQEARKQADVEIADWYERAAKESNLLYFAVVLAADHAPIGEVMLHDIDRESGQAHIHVHVFRSESRDLGHGEHALRAIIEYAFRQLKLRELTLTLRESNFAARRCYAKCGFQVVDRVGDHGSEVVMSLTRDDWRRMTEEEQR